MENIGNSNSGFRKETTDNWKFSVDKLDAFPFKEDAFYECRWKYFIVSLNTILYKQNNEANLPS